MKQRRKRQTSHDFLFFVLPRFVMFFFLVTCCMRLFLTRMAAAAQLTLTRELLQRAAVETFFNVVLLSVLYILIEAVWRKITVERPVRKITEAMEKVIQGDLSAQVPPLFGAGPANGLDLIADYLNVMTAELGHIETLRTDFIANVSHELKTPLAVIQNYGTMLQQQDLPETLRLEYARTITDASRRLADLITNILKLNKLENQEIYPSASDYNLSEQLCECLLAFEDAWEGKALKLETSIEENVTVNADAEMLSLVWNNLFSNAVKFTPPGGHISLTVKSQGDAAVVQVADSGCGIRPEIGERIFEKFFQGDTSHAAAGNGLGLALVKQVIDIVGGDISVESEVGKGSVFTVRIRRKCG